MGFGVAGGQVAACHPLPCALPKRVPPWLLALGRRTAETASKTDASLSLSALTLSIRSRQVTDFSHSSGVRGWYTGVQVQGRTLAYRRLFPPLLKSLFRGTCLIQHSDLMSIEEWFIIWGSPKILHFIIYRGWSLRPACPVMETLFQTKTRSHTRWKQCFERLVSRLSFRLFTKIWLDIQPLDVLSCHVAGTAGDREWRLLLWRWHADLEANPSAEADSPTPMSAVP